MRTNLAMRVLMYCGTKREGLVRAGDVATACNASHHHVAQVVNRLAGMGYLNTYRGRSGGIELARQPEFISVGEVFARFEAGVPLTECFDKEGNTCPLVASCRLRDALIAATRAFYASLDQVTIGDLVCGNHELQIAFSEPASVTCGARKGASGSGGAAAGKAALALAE